MNRRTIKFLPTICAILLLRLLTPPLLYANDLMGREITDPAEKKELVRKMDEAWKKELKQKKKDVILGYGFSMFQNTVYMASRNITQIYPEAKIIQDTHRIFKKGFPKKGITKAAADYTKKSSDWYFEAYKKGQYPDYLIKNAKISETPNTIRVQSNFEKGRFGPEAGEEIIILERPTFRFLALRHNISFKEGKCISLTYSKYLEPHQMAALKTQQEPGMKDVKSKKEMEEFVRDLTQETPRLLELFPWLLEKRGR
jgi:hypothetical protein